jgi:hypothetical protein
MAKTQAERQAEYRARAAKKGDQRFATFLPPETKFALDALAQYHGITLRDVLIGLANNAHKNLLGETAAKAFERSQKAALLGD